MLTNLLFPAQAVPVLIAAVLAAQAPEALSAELKEETVAAYERYLQATQARVDKEVSQPGAFLYVAGLPEPQRGQALATIKRGQVFMTRLATRDTAGRQMRAPDALIHHWFGAVLIPGASLRQVLDLVQDYDHHQDIYKPEVVRSRLTRRDGNDFTIFYRLRKHKVITVTFNTDHEVHYIAADAARVHSRSHATRIAEVADADEPKEREKPVGRDSGFLWRMESWWRFEEHEGGVYVECESVSLTRDIPFLLRGIIGPFITGIPKESLQMTLGSTRSGVLARLGARAATKAASSAQR